MQRTRPNLTARQVAEIVSDRRAGMALAELCAKWRRTRHCLEQAIKRYEERERSIAVREGLRRADPLARSVRAENAARVNAHAAYGRAL